MYYRSFLVFLGVKEAPLSVSYFCRKVKLRKAPLPRRLLDPAEINLTHRNMAECSGSSGLTTSKPCVAAGLRAAAHQTRAHGAAHQLVATLGHGYKSSQKVVRKREFLKNEKFAFNFAHPSFWVLLG